MKVWPVLFSLPQVLLGMLLTLKGGASPGVYKLPPGSPQEKHIVIPLAPSVSRLPSLPISGQQQPPQPKHPQVNYMTLTGDGWSVC